MLPLSLGFVALCTGHLLTLFVLSRRRDRREQQISLALPDLFFVFVLPCLNEAAVVGRSVQRLLELPASNFGILVVDDGSDDGTADAVEPFLGDRVWLLRRFPPDARLGKGAALNAAFQHLRDSTYLEGRDADRVIFAVMDADGRLRSNGLFEVGPHFADPAVAAVQVGVRMNNLHSGLLARMQDIEFVIFTEVFQRGRHRYGVSGLGGNGQFVRLSALASLGPNPWSDTLTEDLDLGLRLMATGWRTSFAARTHVSQQAIVKWRPLLRQRTRWFQGQLQAWRRIPLLLRSSLPMTTTADLVYHLTSPVLILVASITSVTWIGFLLTVALRGSPGALVFGGAWLIPLMTYVLMFGLAPLVAFNYWLRDSETSFVRALLFAHVYTLYCYMWAVAGWRAVARTLLRRRGWAKTARTTEVAAGAVRPAPLPVFAERQ